MPSFSPGTSWDLHPPRSLSLHLRVHFSTGGLAGLNCLTARPSATGGDNYTRIRRFGSVVASCGPGPVSAEFVAILRSVGSAYLCSMTVMVS